MSVNFRVKVVITISAVLTLNRSNWGYILQIPRVYRVMSYMSPSLSHYILWCSRITFQHDWRLTLPLRFFFVFYSVFCFLFACVIWEILKFAFTIVTFRWVRWRSYYYYFAGLRLNSIPVRLTKHICAEDSRTQNIRRTNIPNYSGKRYVRERIQLWPVQWETCQQNSLKTANVLKMLKQIDTSNYRGISKNELVSICLNYQD